MTLVKDLFSENKEWNQRLVSEVFPTEVAQQILTIFPGEGPDKVQWLFNNSKCYDVASGYRISYLFFHEPIDLCPAYMQQRGIWAQLWNLLTPQKITIFLWKCLHGRIPVMQLTHQRFSNTPATCPLCQEESETITHCLFLCQNAKLTWRKIEMEACVPFSNSTTFFDWWSSTTSLLDK
ncbi:hypothetical protein AHAS_Ahas09G0066200 [Arachis hypogaea]